VVLRFQLREVDKRWFVSYLLVVSFFLFFFFSFSFFSFFSVFLVFFFNHALFVSRYKKPYAARAKKRKKPINANPPPASHLHGKNQTPRVHRKSLPRLAPKIIYPRHLRKQYIEMYR